MLDFGKQLGAAIRKKKVNELDTSYDEGPSFFYSGIELEITGDASQQLELVNQLLKEEWVSNTYALNFDDVLDLANYSERISGIGVYKPIFAPYLKREGEERPEWITGGEEFLVNVQNLGSDGKPSGDYQTVKFTKEQMDELEEKFDEAKVTGDDHVKISGVEQLIPLGDAKDILNAFRPEKPYSPEDAPKEAPSAPPTERAGERYELLIKENIEDELYVERRGNLLRFDPATEPMLPKNLCTEFTLKNHQKIGVAWLQNLLGIGPSKVAGCIFADDMGLGKTFQLLTFMMKFLEDNTEAPPCLVVVPVSLIRNWVEEINRFFEVSDDAVKVLYGDKLKTWVMDRKDIDPALIEKGLSKHLQTGWRETARIIITSYETLRDHEISFANEDWSIMVCDEAQKIKSPSALLTRSAKKQKVMFRVACTGTPVENSLIDLWCLFDFIQPSLLPPLKEFTQNYRRPIETSSEADKNAIEKLRAIIDPQVLRRLKTEVADLPPKIHDKACAQLEMSDKQKTLYAQIQQEYHLRKGQSDKPGSFFLAALYRLRMVCADPGYSRVNAPLNISLDDYRKESPKWIGLSSNSKIFENKVKKSLFLPNLKKCSGRSRDMWDNFLGCR